jgi:hypothetical protein
MVYQVNLKEYLLEWLNGLLGGFEGGCFEMDRWNVSFNQAYL